MKEKDFQTGKYDKATKEGERFYGKTNIVFFLVVMLAPQLHFFLSRGDWTTTNLITAVVATLIIAYYIFHIRANRE